MIEVVAEIGINHNGSVETAIAMVNAAHRAGATSVKFQKRIPNTDVPMMQWEVQKDTPWGVMTYLAYKERMELTASDYRLIDIRCKELGLQWFVSVWGVDSLAWMENNFPHTPCYKVPSACITDIGLLGQLSYLRKPVVISTGMSTMGEVREAVDALYGVDLTICHSNSTYPCPVEDLNLNMIGVLQEEFPSATIGYSGHETGLATTVAAVALGAMYIERHFTLDRSAWGSDQSASVEPQGFERLVHDIQNVELAMGNGVKVVTEAEKAVRLKLRGV
jgi:N-acetylneuraminate synthase